MALSIALQAIPDLPSLVADSVSIGTGQSLPIKVNFRNTITEFTAAKRTIEYTVSGLTGNDVAGLQSLAESNLLNLLNKTDPVFRNITISGFFLEDCFVKSVLPSGSLTIESLQLVNDTKLTYETLGYSLV